MSFVRTLRLHLHGKNHYEGKVAVCCFNPYLSYLSHKPWEPSFCLDTILSYAQKNPSPLWLIFVNFVRSGVIWEFGIWAWLEEIMFIGLVKVEISAHRGWYYSLYLVSGFYEHINSLLLALIVAAMWIFGFSLCHFAWPIIINYTWDMIENNPHFP